MNKQLITTYFEEFKHWLNGGNILVKMSTGWSPVIADYNWHLNDRPYIINDDYVEFRKAGAEGKQLQVSYNGGKTWFDKSYRKISWSKSQLVRIKPERHKFKTGDWVIHNGVVKRVTKAVDGYIDSLDTEVAVIMKEESLELWKPNEGEWCIMYDIDEDPNADSVTIQKWDGKWKWKPIPFIGKLPPYIKNNDKKG